MSLIQTLKRMTSLDESESPILVKDLLRQDHVPESNYVRLASFDLIDNKNVAQFNCFETNDRKIDKD